MILLSFLFKGTHSNQLLQRDQLIWESNCLINNGQLVQVQHFAKQICALYMGRWRTRLARRSEKPRTVVRLHPVPPMGMHDALLVSPRFPYQQSDRRLYNQNPIGKTGIRRSMASQFPFCGTLSLCFHFMPPHKIQRAMAAGSVSFSIYLEIYRNKNYYIAESFYIQARSGLFFTLLFSNI